MVAELMNYRSAICLAWISHLSTIKAIDIDKGIRKMQVSLVLVFTLMFNKGSQIL